MFLPIIYISSDHYADILAVNIQRLSKKNNLSYDNMYFILNSHLGKNNLKKCLKNSNVEFDKLKIFISEVKHWGKSLNLLCTLFEKQNYKKALIMLDDFFIDDFSRLKTVVPYFDCYKILYLGTFPTVSKIISRKHKFCLAELNPNYKYGINLQPAVWDIEILGKYCKNFELPWSFEKSIGNFPLKDIKIAVVIPPPLKFSGQAIEKGKWFPIKKYQNRKFIINSNKRKSLNILFYFKKILKDTTKRLINRVLFFKVLTIYFFSKL